MRISEDSRVGFTISVDQNLKVHVSFERVSLFPHNDLPVLHLCFCRTVFEARLSWEEERVWLARLILRESLARETRTVCCHPLHTVLAPYTVHPPMLRHTPSFQSKAV